MSPPDPPFTAPGAPEAPSSPEAVRAVHCAAIPVAEPAASSGVPTLSVAAVVPGPIALVEDGDRIILDVAGGTLDLDVTTEVLEKRLADWVPTPRPARRGVLAKYARLVRSANVGAVCS